MSKKAPKTITIEIYYIIMEGSQGDSSYRIARQDVFYNAPKQNAC